MPELPEVERVCQQLRQEVLKLKITKVTILSDRAFRRRKVVDGFVQRVTGHRINAVNRRGKFILIKLDRDILLVHLGMSGRLYLGQEKTEVKHLHLVIELEEGKILSFADARAFGGVELVTMAELETHPTLSQTGPEPLDDQFDINGLIKKMSQSKVAIKDWLLNQNNIAGIGNIYACEALFDAKILPEKITSELSTSDIKRLYKSLKNILEVAITHGGTTVRDYVSLNAEPGDFQKLLKVYQRRGEACFRCGTKIARIQSKGRSTFFCPHCQK